MATARKQRLLEIELECGAQPQVNMSWNWADSSTRTEKKSIFSAKNSDKRKSLLIARVDPNSKPRGKLRPDRPPRLCRGLS